MKTIHGPDLCHTFSSLEAGEEEALADEGTRYIKSTLSSVDAIYFNPPMPG